MQSKPSHSSNAKQSASQAPQPTSTVPVTYAVGDGIGPEIMRATQAILEAAGARIDWEEITIGEKIYLNGNSAGIEEASWSSMRRTKVFLKAPITTPSGGGVKSLNVTVRKSLGMFANVRPVRSFSPYVPCKHDPIDLVIVRENEEDLYGGIEHRQTAEVTQCLKLITQPGSERICRYAFEYAKRHGRKRVTCLIKDNIMKITDGLFRKAFEQVAAEYPDIASDTRIIDIGTAELANTPDRFDVIVTLNLYGDIVSDVAAQVAGSVGMAGSANLGESVAMFEAVHGSAPDIAGQGIANPSGLLNAAIMMLAHIGQPEVADRVANAWSCTLEDGIHTGDIFSQAHSKERANTARFCEAVIERLGRQPSTLPASRLAEATGAAQPMRLNLSEQAPVNKSLCGVDVFFDWSEDNRDPNVLAARLQQHAGDGWTLKLVTNRGVKVWPEGMHETFCTDHWRARFYGPNDQTTPRDIVALLGRFAEAGLDFIKTEQLYFFDGERGFSLGQGE